MRQVASVLLLPVLLTGVTACQNAVSGPAEQASPAGDDGTAPNGKGRGTHDRSASAVAWIGDTADLGGRVFGEHLQISVRGFVDPAISTHAAQRPRTGKRWMGVDISLVNVGGKPFGSPIRKTWVTDDKGTSYPAVKAGEITTGTPPALNTLPVGEQAQGWLVFEVPENAQIVRFNCTSGTSLRTWQL